VFWWGNLRESDNLEDLGLNWRVVLKRTLQKSVGGLWFDVAAGRGRR